MYQNKCIECLNSFWALNERMHTCDDCKMSSVKAALNTIRAGYWPPRLAKWFGMQIEKHEGHSVVTLARWKNTWYMIKSVDAKTVCTCISHPLVHCRYCGK